MSARLINSLGWWQGFAVLIAFVVIVCSITPLALPAGQDDNDNLPVFLIANLRVNWCESRYSGSARAGTPKAHTMIFCVDALRPTRVNVYPRHVSGRTVIDICSSLRC